MKKIILDITMLLLHRITIISFVCLLLCCYSCVSPLLSASPLNNVAISQDPIIGKWKLVRSGAGRTTQESIAQPYSTIELILEFKPDNILTVQCLRRDNNCRPWYDGDCQYSLFNGMIQIGTTHTWWCRVFENRLIIGNGPADGVDYYFERM